jgi:hypothetical protein
MRFIFFITLVVSLMFVWQVDISSASTIGQELGQQTGAFSGSQGAGFAPAKDPRLVAAQLIKQLLGFVAILFVSYTIYAGYLILTSGGEEEKIMKGKKTLRTAIIGVLIALSTYSITYFVTKNLTKATKSPNKLDEAGVFEGELEFESRPFNPCTEGRGDPSVCGR